MERSDGVTGDRVSTWRVQASSVHMAGREKTEGKKKRRKAKVAGGQLPGQVCGERLVWTCDRINGEYGCDAIL